MALFASLLLVKSSVSSAGPLYSQYAVEYEVENAVIAARDAAAPRKAMEFLLRALLDVLFINAAPIGICAEDCADDDASLVVGDRHDELDAKVEAPSGMDRFKYEATTAEAREWC